jgi:hypothetical protein
MLYILVCALIVSQSAFAQNPGLPVSEAWRPYECANQQQRIDVPWSVEYAQSLGELSPARFLSVDRFADKLPTFAPYAYAADNPLLFVDPSGDSIDVSHLNKEQLSAYTKGLQEKMKSEHFARVWNTLANSKAVYSIVINSHQEKGALYQPNSAESMSGGSLSFRSEEAFSSDFIFSHEGFHAYQHDQRNVDRVVGIEIEANLFANSVSNDLGHPMFMGGVGSNTPEAAAFDQAFGKLQYGETFNQQAWKTTNELFKASGWNDGRYNSYGVKLYRPLIGRFYPLVR